MLSSFEIFALISSIDLSSLVDRCLDAIKDMETMQRKSREHG
jgi:hypothetical protein